jgi:hypothetical protein
MSDQANIAAIYRILAYMPQETLFPSFQQEPSNEYNGEPIFDQFVPCPGLNFLTGSSYVWYTVDGYSTSQRTICGQCKQNHSIDGQFTHHITGPANCDSYYYTNKVDNGIFNYSIWSKDKKICYNGTEDSQVEFLKSDSFHLLISGYKLKQNQYYTYSIYRNDDLIFSSPENTYSKSLELISGLYFLNKTVPYYYLGNNSIFGINDLLKVEINVHKLVFKDPFLNQGDLGTVTLDNGVMYSNKKGSIVYGYGEDRITTGIPLNYEMKPFTVNNISHALSLNCNTDEGLQETEQILVNDRLKVLRTRLNISQKELQQCKANFEFCKSKMADLQSIITNITENIASLNL